jgi:hypothetical protein
MNETFLKVVYLVAISLATAGWLWLLARVGMALFDP